MQPAHAKELRCPRGDHALVLEAGAQETNGDVREGALVCPLDGTQVPIRGSIPRFREDDGYAANFGEQWNRFRRTQLDRFNGTTLSRDRFYAGTGWTPGELEGARVLEVGCGAGRFTQVLLEAGASVFALDYSSAVDACHANHGPHPRLCVAQADLFRMPFEAGSFDHVFCYGVLQHTPDPRGAFLALARFLKPGGRIAVDVYRKGWALAPYKSKYLWRPLTRRLPHPVLFRAIQWYVPRWLPLDTRIKRLPRIGNALGMVIPCWNYSDRPLTPSQQVEWAVLDTFDALAPRYDLPQRPATVEAWFREAGLQDVSVRPGGNGLLGNARAPRRPPC